MTNPDKHKGRRRHILKPSARFALKLGADTRPPTGESLTADPEINEALTMAAAEPESGSIERLASADTAEAPTADEPVGGSTDPADADEAAESVVAAPERRGDAMVTKLFAFGVLPFFAVSLAIAVGWLTFTDIKAGQIREARDQAVQTARDSTVTLLSYNPNTVEKQLTDARGLLTGQFKDSYTQLTTDVVIPGSVQQRISAVATVPRAASVSTEISHSVVLVFVNQTVVVNDSAPTATLSSVRVTLEKIDERWLVSMFEPV